ncbi:hypothetical protein LTS17_005796 [Exophiala oligosperma]
MSPRSPLSSSDNDDHPVAAAHVQRAEHEASINRNPHPDFIRVQASRPDWSESHAASSSSSSWKFTKTRDPNWKWGQGGNDNGESLDKNHVEIDPYAPGRPSNFNYKLLISGIVPRPIGFYSTVSKDGVLNMVSEHFIEAANATSINSPHGVSEWSLSGLHPEASTHVKPARVKESVFAIECKLVEVREFESRSKPGRKSGAMVILEGINFWVREDAINEDLNMIDPDIIRPICRLGGITYGRVTEGFELLRPEYEKTKASGALDATTSTSTSDTEATTPKPTTTTTTTTRTRDKL